ncbi:alcohol dehydrogenase zinc-binding domain protein [Penicillium chermesinum]|uniref:Alcohol dehydrogenase zinc-binding domain protein n=1 Tax=Penicillium chermesinum TaxID=63820 RepID=A0A9W9NGL4_9EURO|nr:alcohol dehydrogenase zinc-binding domain protein [Penicillium chermesinum]KAJ5219595.1 alcohol dehydrogenase zinc-binding domain protein [Penicillium chermesinum]
MKAAILPAFGQPLEIHTKPDPPNRHRRSPRRSSRSPNLPLHQRSPKRCPQIPAPSPRNARLRRHRPCDRYRARRNDPAAWRLGILRPNRAQQRQPLQPGHRAAGWSARGPGGQKIQAYHRDGTFASRVRVPTENAIPIGEIEDAEAGHWCALAALLIPYGGLLAMEFRAGETLLVSGATGPLGGATVLLALAMGAREVIAVGRNEGKLAQLRERLGPRVVPVKLSGDSEKDIAAMKAAAAGGIDAVLDFLPPAASATVARSAIMAVRPYGRVVLMGGVGMLGGEELQLPYPWIMRNLITIKGQWMYEPSAVRTIVGMIRSGQLDISAFDVTEFSLENINEAVDHAAETGGPFKLTIARP